MKILHCIPTLDCGGAERQLSYLGPELTRLGHEVHVAYLRGGMNLERLHRSDVHLHHLRVQSNYDPIILLHLDKLVRKIQPDILHTWILQMDILGGMIALARNIKWIIREPGSKMGYPNTFKYNLRQRLGQRVNAIIANSNGGIEYWRACGYKDNIYLIPNSLPLKEISSEKIFCFNEIHKNNNDKFVLFVGRILDKIKNIEKLILALININRKIKLKAVLCGDGPDRIRLTEFINKNCKKNSIFLIGEVNNIWGLMKGADVFVSASYFEGRPNAVLEAMACGCPLVVSDIPAHKEFLDEKSAVFVDPYDVGDIANGITMVLENPDAARARAETAKRKAIQWDILEITRQYEEVYLEICRNAKTKSET